MGSWSASCRPTRRATPVGEILGERPSPQRYALRYETDQWQWNDTYYLKYDGLLGDAAYRKAVNNHHFALIYLDNTTGHAVRTQLLSQPRSTASTCCRPRCRDTCAASARALGGVGAT